jgi:hypothetical protein
MKLLNESGSGNTSIKEATENKVLMRVFGPNRHEVTGAS